MPRYVTVTVCSAGNRGNTGDAGDPRTEPIPQGTAGQEGSVGAASVDEFQHLPVAPNIGWLVEYLHKAELDYVNQQMEPCVEKLGWIAQLLDMVSRSSIDTVNPDSFMPIRQKLAALTNSIEQGLDPFGRGRNYVPLTTYSFLRENAERIITHARHIETKHQSLTEELKDQNTAREAAFQAIHDMEATLARQKQLVDAEHEAIKDLQNRSNSLYAELEAAWTELNDAADEFKQAITQEAGCGFEDVLQFGMMVATVVSTGGAGIAMVGAVKTSIDGINKINQAPSEEGTWFEMMDSDFKAIAEVVKPAGASINEFKTSYATSKKLIDERFGTDASQEVGPSSPSNDYVKLVAAKEDFDREIQPFLKMDAARRYKQQMDLFVSTAETRNNLILEHDEKLSHALSMWSNMATQRAETSEILARLDVDFELPEVTNFLGRSLQRIKWDLVRTVTSLAKSIEYMSMKPIEVAIDDRSVASIETSLASIDGVHRRVMSEFAQGKIPFQGIEVRLKDILTDKQKETLIRGEVAVFSLSANEPADPFEYRYAVTTRKIGLTFVSDLELKDYKVLFEHLGRSLVRDRLGNHLVYSHPPVRTMVQINERGHRSGKGGLNENSNDYVGVSPYGPWRIKIDTDNAEDRRRIVELAYLSFDVAGRVGQFS